MTAYLDRELAARDRERLETHLADCPHCFEYLAQLRVTIDALGHLDPDELPEAAIDDLVELYRRWPAKRASRVASRIRSANYVPEQFATEVRAFLARHADA